MKRLNSRQYRILVKFCRDLFQKQGYISQQKLNLLIKQNINPCATRYRRLLVEIMFLSERNKLMYPGPMLYHFRQQDFYIMNKLMKSGSVIIIDKEIHYSPAEPNNPIELPKHWEIISNNSKKQVFKLLS